MENVLAFSVKGERSTEAFGGVSREVIRAISALDEASIDDPLQQARPAEAVIFRGLRESGVDRFPLEGQIAPGQKEKSLPDPLHAWSGTISRSGISIRIWSCNKWPRLRPVQPVLKVLQIPTWEPQPGRMVTFYP